MYNSGFIVTLPETGKIMVDTNVITTEKSDDHGNWHTIVMIRQYPGNHRPYVGAATHAPVDSFDPYIGQRVALVRALKAFIFDRVPGLSLDDKRVASLARKVLWTCDNPEKAAEIFAEQKARALERAAAMKAAKDAIEANKPRQRGRIEKLEGAFSDLSGVNLGGVMIKTVNLHHADLGAANLRCAVFSNTNFEYANLSGADLSLAKMVGGKFTYATLRSARLYKADLRSANFTGADLRNATHLDTASVQGAMYDAFTKFPDDFDPEAAGMKLMEVRAAISLYDDKPQPFNKIAFPTGWPMAPKITDLHAVIEGNGNGAASSE